MQKQRPKVKTYDYTSFGDFFTAAVKMWKVLDRRVSYKWICRRLDMGSPTQLAHYAKGRRLPSFEQVEQLGELMQLPKRQVKYLKALVGYERCQDPDEKEMYGDRLLSLRPDREQWIIELDQLKFISRWYYIAILEMVSLDDFKPDPAWIARRLGNKVAPKQAHEALNALKRLGLLATTDGQMEKSNLSFRSPSGIPNKALQRFHSDMLDLAKEAITERPVEDRFLMGQTLTIDKNRLPEAQEIIVEFFHKMRKVMPSEAGTETYHVSTQLFPLTGKHKS